jgi:hypothetical protein
VFRYGYAPKNATEGVLKRRFFEEAKTEATNKKTKKFFLYHARARTRANAFSKKQFLFFLL